MTNNDIQLRQLDKPTEHEAGCFVCGSSLVVAYIGRPFVGNMSTVVVIKVGGKTGTAVFCSECVGKVKMVPGDCGIPGFPIIYTTAAHK